MRLIDADKLIECVKMLANEYPHNAYLTNKIVYMINHVPTAPESDKLQKIEARLREWEFTRANMCDADFECIGDIKLILKGESEDAIHNHNN